jgi:asparagine synthetase B (glutamine-hydrolysing)
MIVYPNNWRDIGKTPTIKEIENSIFEVVADLGCENLALSGGIDSSYMLWCMVQVFGKENIKCYTIALSNNHPDYVCSEQIVEALGIVNWFYYIPSNKEVKELLKDKDGNLIVKKFFNWLECEKKVSEIICCDGIDEFMGGYYDHLHNPTHETYYDFMVRLQDEQLRPLNENSGKINVLLPYMSKDLIELYNRIPMNNRFDSNGRKKIMVELAKDKIPDKIIYRRKYGFVDAMRIKG